MNKSISRKIIGGVLGISFIIAVFLGGHMTIQMNSHWVMQNCPLLGHTEEVCTMTATEHIAKWQQLFTATVHSSKILFAALLLMSLAFVAFSFQFSSLNQLNFQTFTSRAGPLGYVSGFLLRAFGRGILRKRE